MHQVLRIVTVVSAIAITLAAVGVGASEDPTDLHSALNRALDDERHAQAFFRAVIAKHGERRPFSKIVQAEGRHASALLAQYERLGLTPPPDRWVDHVFDVPPTFRESCDAAYFAEIRNGRLYDQLLAAAAGDEHVQAVFRRLQQRSIERHRPAFARHGSGWHVVAEEGTAAQQAQVARADAAKNELFGALIGRVGAEIGRSGPAGAITVCKAEAPVIAKQVGEQHGLAIGRTSWRLRNPENTGPDWLTLALAGRPETPVRLADRTGRLGWVAPIRINAMCLTCHGDPATMMPEVRERIAALYPDDRATGYGPGDLRGWFWVEVPPASPPE